LTHSDDLAFTQKADVIRKEGDVIEKHRNQVKSAVRATLECSTADCVVSGTEELVDTVQLFQGDPTDSSKVNFDDVVGALAEGDDEKECSRRETRFKAERRETSGGAQPDALLPDESCTETGAITSADDGQRPSPNVCGTAVLKDRLRVDLATEGPTTRTDADNVSDLECEDMGDFHRDTNFEKIAENQETISDATPNSTSVVVKIRKTGFLRRRWPNLRKRRQQGLDIRDELNPSINDAGADDGSCQTLSLADDAWLVVDHSGSVLEEDDGKWLTPSGMEAKIGGVMTWMLSPAVHGVGGKFGVPSAVERAAEILIGHDRDVDASVREVVAGSERSVSKLVIDFCLERIPVIGCPSVLLKTTWGNLRSILIIAALYGHDLESPRVQHEALLCMVPAGEEVDKPWLGCFGSRSFVVSETAQRVAKIMIKSALRRATGLEAAAECFELASILYRTIGEHDVDEDGFVHVVGTPASAARDFFRRRPSTSCVWLWTLFSVLLLGTVSPLLRTLLPWMATAVAAGFTWFLQVPRWCLAVLPMLVFVTVGLHLALLTTGLYGRLSRGRGRRPQRSVQHLWRSFLPWPRIQRLRDSWPEILTTLVFTLHAVMPAISTFSALLLILPRQSATLGDATYLRGWDNLHRVACIVLGVQSLCSGVARHIESEHSDVHSCTSRVVRTLHRVCNSARPVARACCVFAAWTYALLVLDLAVTRLASWYSLPGDTALGIVRPLANLFGASLEENVWSEEAAFFMCSFVSVSCQQFLLELLSRREVLFRLIGAEHVMASSLCLVLQGMTLAISNAASSLRNGVNPIAEFLTRVAPPPVCCVTILALREQAVFLGITAALGPRLVQELMQKWVVGVLGLCIGAYISWSVLRAWYTNEPELDSPAIRLTLLLPGGISSRAKGLLRSLLVGAQTRAVKLMAMKFVERTLRLLSLRVG